MSDSPKTAIVTGASQGIGAGIVKGFVERGFNVVANSRKVTQSTEVAATDHVAEHLLTMAKLHAANRYDRLTHDVEAITGRPATSARDFVARHAESFAR